jgi:XisI protein
MDKIKQYQDIIIEFLQHYDAQSGSSTNKVMRRLLIDRQNNSFQLLVNGWNGQYYVFSPMFHFDIIDGKIWMQCNNTEWEVVDFLMEHGVPRQDIVLGFVAPQARAYSGFAVQ